VKDAVRGKHITKSAETQEGNRTYQIAKYCAGIATRKHSKLLQTPFFSLSIDFSQEPLSTEDLRIKKRRWLTNCFKRRRVNRAAEGALLS
jgi:hypothetical protein